ncbi:MAG: hypothetical protein U0325_05100 [Polyangiales bacterium]
MSVTMSPRGFLPTVLGALALVSACGGDRADLAQGHASLTADQCSYFAAGDTVTICHRTGAARRPYTILRTNVASCGGHAGHDGDYIASSDPRSPLYDPTCNGQGCLPAGAPADGTIECCAGLTNVGGVCASATPRLVDIRLVQPPGTWEASGYCGGWYKLFVYGYAADPDAAPLLNGGHRQGLDVPLNAGQHVFRLRSSPFFGGASSVRLTLSDGTTLSADGDVTGTNPAPAVTVGGRTYQITSFETIQRDDRLGCDESAPPDGQPDLFGEVVLTVTDP